MKKVIALSICFIILLCSCNPNQVHQTSEKGVYWLATENQLAQDNTKNNGSNDLIKVVTIRDSIVIHLTNPIDSTIQNLDIVEVVLDSEDLKLIKACRKKTDPNGKKMSICKFEAHLSKSQTNIEQFKWAWIQMSISVFAIIVWIMLWYLYKRNIAEEKDTDIGVWLLATAILLWSIIGLVSIYENNVLRSQIYVQSLSILNNFFFIMSFPYFNHRIKIFNIDKTWYWVVSIVIFLIALIPNIFLLISGHIQLAKYVNLIYSVIVLIILGILLFRSFNARKLYGIAILSSCVLGIIALVQVMVTMDGGNYFFGEVDQILYYSSFVALLMLFTAQIFSWYNELSERSIAISFLNSVGNLNEDGTVKIEKRPKEYYYELVVEDKIASCLSSLNSEERVRNKMELHKSVIHNLSEISRLLNSKLNNSISEEDFSLKRSRIRENTLEIIDRAFKSKPN